ncbi:tyrosine-type recombinase/integrase [Paracoccaceae bacterium]|nr:tyrosine-type recombinase/integrase [Paracoccaceae bacterium]
MLDLQRTLTFATGSWYRMVDQKHLYLTKKNGVYYYTRRVPRKLISSFGRERLVKCLHTRSTLKAKRISLEVNSRIESIWDRLRLDLEDFRPVPFSAPQKKFKETEETSSILSDAEKLYLRLKDGTRSATFKSATKRNLGYLIECIGDIDVTQIQPQHGTAFRDFLMNKGLSSSSIRRVFSTVKAVINLTISEKGLQARNIFTSVYIPDDTKTKTRIPIPVAYIQKIQKECIEWDDEMRWLIALISDTGLRLSEACGLAIDDIHLTAQIPHLEIKPHSWRGLKTKSSKRKIPLVGMANWAANRVTRSGDGKFAFPKYCSLDGVKANSASGALNKWLSLRTPKDCVVHSFRHSFRDRLRAIECPSEIIDELGGWSRANIGSQYGQGYSLEIKDKYLRRLTTEATF